MRPITAMVQRLLARILIGCVTAMMLVPSPLVMAEDLAPIPAVEPSVTVAPPDKIFVPDIEPQAQVAETAVLPTVAPPSPTPLVVEQPNSVAVVVPPAPPQLANPFPVAGSEPVVVSSFKITPRYGFDFIELYNSDDAMASVEGMSIRLLYSTTAPAPEMDYECTIELHGYARANSYVTYSTRGATDGAYGVAGCPNPNAQLFDKEIQVRRGQTPIEIIRIAAVDMTETSPKQWERGGWTATYRKGILKTDFKTATRATYYTSSFYEPPAAPNVQFLEIFPRPLSCSSGDPSPLCRPYIKLKNTGSAPIDLSQFRLRNGSLTAASSRFNTSSLAARIIQPNEFVTIVTAADGKPLAINDADGATWLEDMYGLATYPNNDAPYSDADLVAQTGLSWAFDSNDNQWKWAVPSPFGEQNNFALPGKGSTGTPSSTTLKPCADNQYRSEETNRCRLISSLATSTLTPCKEGQYRSEETNRCRSIAATAAATLKPCEDDQFRNPATGRCKKIASTDDILAACPAGKERNPDTNRCRNVISDTVPAAAFAVEPIKQGAKSFVGWWALGGVLLAAGGYAAWEWRREIVSQIRKTRTFFTDRK